MEYKEVVKNRFAARAFLPNQIRLSDLKDIILEAERTPTWMNAQERKIFLATGNTTRMIRSEYMDRAEKGVIGISDFTVVHRTEWSGAAQKNMDHFEKEMEDYLGEELETFVKAQDTLFQAPALLFLVLPKDASKWAVLDMGAFEEAIILGAASRGIDSLVAYSIIKYPDIIRKHFPISEKEDIVMGIALGYADKEAKINQFRSRRVPLSDILFTAE